MCIRDRSRGVRLADDGIGVREADARLHRRAVAGFRADELVRAHVVRVEARDLTEVCVVVDRWLRVGPAGVAQALVGPVLRVDARGVHPEMERALLVVGTVSYTHLTL